MKIVDNVIFESRLSSYFNNEFCLENEAIVAKSPVIICDNYKNEQQIVSLDNVKFRVGKDSIPWIVHPVGVVDDKIINITHKMMSYFAIIIPGLLWKHGDIMATYNAVQNTSDVITVEEDVFQFFDCFPYASVHNLDDTYNLLYQYQKHNLKCKLLVIKSDNFYYNQTLNSLKDHFGLEYIYLDLNQNYMFKKFHCTRQYHWIQDDALAFIKQNYISKICDKFSGKKTYDNVAIIKTGHATDCSTIDTFPITDAYKDLLVRKNIVDFNDFRDDLEYKIYVVNHAKNIIASYLSPFNVNIHKHCIDTSDKNFLVINGRYGGSFMNQFIKVGDKEYSFYGLKIRGTVIDDAISLDQVTCHIDF